MNIRTNSMNCEESIMIVMTGLTTTSRKNLEHKGNHIYLSNNEPLEELAYLGPRRLIVELAAKLFDADITAIEISKANLVFMLMEVEANKTFTIELPMLPTTEKLLRQLAITNGFVSTLDNCLEYFKDIATLDTLELEQVADKTNLRQIVSSVNGPLEILTLAEQLGLMLWEYESRLRTKASACFRSPSYELT